MINTTPALARQEFHTMLTVDCPLCDAPAPYDTDADELDCPACAIRLDLAADPSPAPLLAAA